MLTVFLALGFLGIIMLLLSVFIGEAVEGFFDGFGPDFLSGAAAAGFFGALGFVGAWVLDATDSTSIASAAGVVAGLGVGGLTGWGTKALMRGGDEANVTTGGLVGLTGNVVADIPAAGMGQISVVAAGHITRLNARCESPLAAGQAVVITNVLSPTSVVVAEHHPDVTTA